MSDEQADVLLMHLARFKVGPHECPICGANAWQPHMLESVTSIVPDSHGATVSKVPLVMLMCSGCWFVRHFAWKPIEDAAKAEKP